MTRALAGAMLAAMTWVAPVSAQTYRTVTETRRVAGNRPLAVDASFTAGDLVIAPADGRLTYRVAMTYLEDVFQPTIRFDENAGTLAIKMGGNGDVHVGDQDRLKQVFDVGLPRDVPLDLALSFGAVQATVELGELTIRSATIKTGASETTVAFSKPTRGSCERLELNVGAAQFEALKLGNSGCRMVTLQGAVGEMVLDFSGDRLAGETHLSVKVGLGEVRLRIPQSVGIRMNTDRFLATLEHAGLVKRGSAFFSPGYENASAKLIVDVNAALGSVEIERN